MIRGVFGGFGVKCLEEGLCESELTHRAGGLFRGSSRSKDLRQWIKVCQVALLGVARLDG